MSQDLNDIVISNENVTFEKMERALKDIGFNYYERRVYSGNEIIPGKMYPKSALKGTFEKNETCFDNDFEPIGDYEAFYKELKKGETNDLFKKAFRVIKKKAKKFGYDTKSLFKLVYHLSCFSFFGRDKFEVSINEDKFNIELKMKYIDPSLDEPDLLKDKQNVIHKNRKITHVIYNKTTGVVCKSELTNTYSYVSFIWECSTGKKLVTSTSLLNYVGTGVDQWRIKSTGNFFYDNNYIFRVENIVDGKCAVDNYDLPEGHQSGSDKEVIQFDKCLCKDKQNCSHTKTQKNILAEKCNHRGNNQGNRNTPKKGNRNTPKKGNKGKKGNQTTVKQDVKTDDNQVTPNKGNKVDKYNIRKGDNAPKIKSDPLIDNVEDLTVKALFEERESTLTSDDLKNELVELESPRKQGKKSPKKDTPIAIVEVPPIVIEASPRKKSPPKKDAPEVVDETPVVEVVVDETPVEVVVVDETPVVEVVVDETPVVEVVVKASPKKSPRKKSPKKSPKKSTSGFVISDETPSVEVVVEASPKKCTYASIVEGSPKKCT